MNWKGATKTMNEKKAQEYIRQAVLDNLSWLDELPSQESEILEKTKEEVLPLVTVYSKKSNMPDPAYTPQYNVNHSLRLRPVLAFCAVLVLLTGVWAVYRSNSMDNQFTPLDAVTEAAGIETTPGTPDQDSGSPALPAAVSGTESSEPETSSLDRIDLYVDPDLLWNNETGILADGDNIVKEPGKVPFKNATYRKMKDSGIKVDGELVYQSNARAVLFRDKIKLRLAGDYSLDMPQKSFHIDAADGSFDFPLFEDRSASSYPSILLRNSGNDSMWTRVQDGVQHRLIDKYTDTGLLTQAWRPVNVYLNDEYRGIYNMRETIDGHTVCRHEQIPDEMADSVAILSMNGTAKQGNNKEFKEMRKKIAGSHPGDNPEDLAFLEQEIDINSFLDWLTVEMYFGNSDIGNGVIYKVPGGKWKCLINDLDYGLFSSQFNSVKSYLKDAGMGDQKVNNTIFLKILEVEKYKDLFFTKLGNLFRSLTTENMWKELDECVAWIKPDMKAHVERWAPEYDKYVIEEVPTNAVAAYQYWEKRVNRLRNVMHKRPTMLYGFIQDYFSMSSEEMDVYFPSDIPATVEDLIF